MKIRLDPGAYAPTRAHSTDAGLDLRAMRGGTVPPGGSAIFETGLHVQLPPGTAGILVSRSGLKLTHGITSDGLIDEGYTGQIMVKLYNHGWHPYEVRAGDRITQLVVIPVLYETIENVTELEPGDRGERGFGSSGI